MAANKRKPTLDELKGLPPDPTAKSGIPDHIAESFARILLPDIIAFYDSEEGQKEYEERKQKQEIKSNKAEDRLLLLINQTAYEVFI